MVFKGLHQGSTHGGPVRVQQQRSKWRCAGSIGTVLDTEGLITRRQLVVGIRWLTVAAPFRKTTGGTRRGGGNRLVGCNVLHRREISLRRRFINCLLIIWTHTAKNNKEMIIISKSHNNNSNNNNNAMLKASCTCDEADSGHTLKRRNINQKKTWGHRINFTMVFRRNGLEQTGHGFILAFFFCSFFTAPSGFADNTAPCLSVLGTPHLYCCLFFGLCGPKFPNLEQGFLNVPCGEGDVSDPKRPSEDLQPHLNKWWLWWFHGSRATFFSQASAPGVRPQSLTLSHHSCPPHTHTNHNQSLHMIARISQSREGKRRRREGKWNVVRPKSNTRQIWGEWNVMQPIP